MTISDVKLSGVVLSSLFYEHVNGISDQEGFLLGVITDQVKNTITDSQISGHTTKRIVSVQSIWPCSECHLFYNSVGKVDEETVHQLTSGSKCVVGWYRSRRQSTALPFLREKVVHQQLSLLHQPKDPEGFLLCLVTSESECNKQNFNYVFFSRVRNLFCPVSSHVVNLQHTSQSEYHSNSITSVDLSSGIIKDLIDDSQSSKDEAVEHVERIHKNLKEQLTILASSVASASTELTRLNRLHSATCEAEPVNCSKQGNL